MSNSEVSVLYKKLNAEWSSPSPNLSKCEQLLSKLKVSAYLHQILLNDAMKNILG